MSRSGPSGGVGCSVAGFFDETEVSQKGFGQLGRRQVVFFEDSIAIVVGDALGARSRFTDGAIAVQVVRRLPPTGKVTVDDEPTPAEWHRLLHLPLKTL